MPYDNRIQILPRPTGGEVNKREFQEQALLRALDNTHPVSQIVRAAGEAYDEFLGAEKPTDSGWIRFSDRAPTEADCILKYDALMLHVWYQEEQGPSHWNLEAAIDELSGRPDCFWRPIHPRPESK
jgi:hypothetical protein